MGTTTGLIISSSFLREMEIATAIVEAASVNRRNSSLVFLSYFQEAQSYLLLPDTWVLIVTNRDTTDKRQTVLRSLYLVLAH